MFAAAAAVLAVLTIIGWIFGIRTLVDVFPNLITMKFNAAIAVALLAATWFLPRRPALLSAFVAGFLALATIVEYLGNVHDGIDNLFVRDFGQVPHPGRMALTTACCLLALAIPIVTNLLGRRRLVQTAATFVLVLSVLTTLGYVYGVPYLTYLGPFSTPALTTATTLALLSVALLLTVDRSELWWMLRGHDVGARTLRTLLPWTLLALPVFGCLQLASLNKDWYDSRVGVTLSVGASALVLTLVTWKAARTMASVDRRRAAAMAELKALSEELEQRVKARTRELEHEREGLRAAEAVARVSQLEAEQASNAQNEFLSRASHELRTPLNAILGFAQILELDPMAPAQEAAVGHIIRGGKHLLALVNDVLDITGIESDQLELSQEPVMMAALVSEMIGSIRAQAAADEVEIHFDGQTDSPAYVRADRRRLKQIMLNLLSNAIKYNHPGGRIDIRVSTIDDAHLSVAVSDTGMGIKADDLPKLFAPFDRLGRQSASVEGTGLGLALSKHFAGLMGGRLEVSSTPGSGSTFTVTLPISPPPEQLGAMHQQGADELDREVVLSTVLYIEDNPADVALLNGILGRRPGWAMTHAGSGRLGIELAASITPTVILLDLHLPDVDGADVLARLRANPKSSSVPVAILSADAGPAQIRRLLAAGAQEFLAKSNGIQEVLQFLDAHAA